MNSRFGLAGYIARFSFAAILIIVNAGFALYDLRILLGA